ncbi:mucin-2-like [Daphnia pulex]|uniref:mucin-2-like n=1 Tax=Daphnia pulex TaxID=6669 RepID=UPI001EDDB546|nr:mucin-2-like [Daphnia pulex]
MAPTFLFIVLAALVHFSSAASNNYPSFRQVRRINIRKQNGRQTPTPFNCVKAGFFGDPKDCFRFYRCVDYYGNEAQFTLFEFVCAEGTIFDESLSVCNHPHAVNPPPACLATTSWVTTTVAPPAPVPPAPPATVPPAPPVVTAAVETTTVAAAPVTETTTASNPPTQPNNGNVETTIAPAAPVTGQPAVTDLPTGPTTAPTVPPTDAPMAVPTAPTAAPTDAPTAAPTAPTVPPTDAPTAPPTAPIVPTAAPTVPPTDAPTAAPTAPTTAPTEAPTAPPTAPTVPTTEFAPDVLPVDPVTTTTAAPAPEPTTAAPAPVTTTVAAPATTTVSSGEMDLTPAITPIVPPPTDVAPFMLTCNDDKYHRHPVRCDLYYKCVWTELAFSVDLRACPAGLHYDEASGTCKSPGRTTACVFATLPPTGVVTTVPTTTTEITTVPTTTTVATEAPPTVPTTTVATEAPVTAAATTTVPATTAPSVPAQYTLAPGSLYDCKMPGHYPYQLDCIRFYRCFEIEPSVLKGLLYRCPVDYAYSTVTQRCVRQNTLPACDRNGIRLPMDFPVPLIPLEDTTMVLLEDFDSFFGNPNYFYIPRRKIKNPQSSRIRNKPQPQPKNKRY